MAEKITPLLTEFNTFSPEQKEAFVRMMVDQHEGALRGRSDKIMQAVEGLPEFERNALALKLKETLKAEFDDVAVRPPANEDDDGPIVAPRTASFSRRSKAQAATV